MRPQAGLAELVRGDASRRARAASRRCRARARPAARTAPRRRRRCRDDAGRSAACVERQREGARRGAGIVVLVRERLGGLAIGGHAGGEATAAPCAPGASRIALAQADDRIEHDAGRARQRAAVERQRDARRRGRGRGSARGRFPIRPGPAAGPRGSARAPPRRRRRPDRAGRRWQSSAALSGRYSVSRNSLPNAGCARSSTADGEHDLGVAGHVDLADARAVVADRQRRTSTSSSVETAMSSWVEMSSSRRRKVARSAGTSTGSRRARAASADRSPTRPRRSGRRAGR